MHCIPVYLMYLFVQNVIVIGIQKTEEIGECKMRYLTNPSAMKPPEKYEKGLFFLDFFSKMHIFRCKGFSPPSVEHHNIHHAFLSYLLVLKGLLLDLEFESECNRNFAYRP